MQIRRSAHLFASISLFALAACSGGGGSGTALNAAPATPPGSPQTLITFRGSSGVSYAANPVLATNAAPNFSTDPPPVGTSFPLIMTGQSITRLSSTSAIPPNSITVSSVSGFDGSEIYEGRFTTAGGVTYPLLGLNIPGLNIHAIGLKGDGTAAAQFDGSKVAIAATNMNYLLLGAWTYQAPNATDAAFGLTIAGYQTPAGNVPTTGTATYVGSASGGAKAGGVLGTVIMKSGNDNIAVATLSGNVNFNVNFATQEANGTLTDMTAKDVISGTTSPWNNVTLTGKLHATWSRAAGGTGAYLEGAAQIQAAPAGATFGMDPSAQGSVGGALFGPNANEIAGGWSLYDNSPRTAMGIFGATKQ